jgi:hypothetical protein
MKLTLSWALGHRMKKKKKTNLSSFFFKENVS